MRVLVNGIQVQYELEGPSSGPVVLLAHSLATNLSIWEPQVRMLAENFRVLRYDALGHGGTGVPAGPYTMDRLATQAAGLLGALGLERVHFMGLSMGGMIAQLLAIRAPRKLASLLLCSTTSRIPPEALALWQERIRIAETEGMEPLVEPTIGRWFTPPFRIAHPDVIDKVRAMIRATPPAGYSACCHAVSRLDLAAELQAIRAPTLMIVGEEDPGTPVEACRTIQEQIPGSELAIIPSASHLSNLEQTEPFNQAVSSFLARVV
ncbi:MAG: Alpha/beta hydrolase fold [Acidobacteria bacterium]|nr:Alpha/beta hydrolase fold [Acidobacteriota bacterium]